MNYTSTRDSRLSVTSAQAIARGISAEGGLFVPESIPTLTAEKLASLIDMPYVDRATAVLSTFLTDFTADEVADCTTSAYSTERFRHADIAPLYTLDNGVEVLELWHGPTCAFKDMALQILPHLMRVSAAKTVDGKEIIILVATSGDTGKAALEGFKDAPATRILVFYPEEGVSPMQKLQMCTQEGENVGVCAIRGNFDDAQSGVKSLFTDEAMQAELAAQNRMFSSANSINWGRLAPQIVYYISAYCDLLKKGVLKMGEPMNVVVPTGNFGNILAAYYAKRMGLPVGKLICASNRNCVLTDFLKTGTYDRNRAFFTTTSPSMDILISSNLERLLYELSGRDDAQIRLWMEQLAREGKYTVSAEVKAQLDDLFVAGWCSDDEAADTIRVQFEEKGYLLDPHTAVAVKVYNDYRAQSGDTAPVVIASTANPYKFSSSVLKALGADREEWDEFEKVEGLNAATGAPVPAPLASLKGKQPRFTKICDKTEMQDAVRELLHGNR
ncbi:MAG: threonine synthase [Clostridia bacterium]|nr:threonine synthase [Clostridia bacterium]